MVRGGDGHASVGIPAGGGAEAGSRAASARKPRETGAAWAAPVTDLGDGAAFGRSPCTVE